MSGYRTPPPLCERPSCDQLATGMVAVEASATSWVGRLLCTGHARQLLERMGATP